LAQKKNISGVRVGACGLPTAKKGPRNKFCGCAALEGLRGAPGVCAKGGTDRGPEQGYCRGALLGPTGGTLCWPKKRTFLGCAWLPVGFEWQKRGSKTRFAAATPSGAAGGHLGCAPSGALPGDPDGGAAVVHFLGLLGAPFVGPEKEHLRGARGCLWASSGKKGPKKQGLRLQCPGGLLGGTWGVRQGGASQQPRTGVL